MIKTSLVFDHRQRTEKGQEGPIEVRVTIDRKPYYINTGVKCRRSEWTGQRIINRRADADELNDRIEVLLRRIEQEITLCLDEGRTIDVAEIRRKVWMQQEAKSHTGTPLIDWLENQAEVLQLAPGTRKHYTTLFLRMRAYGNLRLWSDVTVEGIYMFDDWLHRLEKKQSDAARKAGVKPERISDAAVYNYHKCLKALLTRAEKFGKIQRNPYDRMKGEFKRGDRVDHIDYLTEQEMEDFVAIVPKQGTQMAVAHDLFVFQMYTGLSYSDAQAFDISEYRNIDGKWVNIGERIKTGTPYVSQLLPPAVEVLEKYGWRIPKINNADYNKCLKALGMVAGIDKPLHSHMARHTFATWMLRHNVRIEHVSRMLGHTNITQTQRYARVMAQAIHEDFDRVEKLIQKQP